MRRHMLLAGCGLPIIMVVCALLWIGARSATPGCYRAAVETVLARRGVEQQGVRVVDGCAPSYQFCRHYHADVTVRAGQPLPGTIDCRWRWTGCTLTIAELGLHDEPLADTMTPLTRQDIEQILRDIVAGLLHGLR
jgi:hypothetical protein